MYLNVFGKHSLIYQRYTQTILKHIQNILVDIQGINIKDIGQKLQNRKHCVNNVFALIT